MENKPHMTYHQLVEGYRAKGCRLKYYGKIKEDRKTYRLYKFVLEPRYKTTLLITAGFHGDEFNGPISLLEIYEKLVALAKKYRVRIVAYICINPEGFDKSKHYNSSAESKKYGNNDWMRYRIRGRNKWVGTLRTADEHYFATRKVYSAAKEVRLLQKDLKKHYDDYRVPDAVLDIHQQKGNLATGEIYAFIFDRPAVYLRIMKKLEKIAPIARNERWTDKDDGREIRKRIDQDGFVFIHDGTITDVFYRHGTKWAVTAETKTTLPLEKVALSNLIWAKELIKLIARDAKKKKNKRKKKE